MRQGVTIWLTGLPSAGKSTIARRLVERLEPRGLPVVVLDGDEVRENLTKGLGFSREDRDENIKRIAWVARLLSRVGAVVVVAAISPYRAARDAARASIGRFAEIHVHCPVEECIRRDVKGLYKKALDGRIQHFTGIDDPYEPPLNPEVEVRTHRETVDESAARIVATLEAFGFLPVETADAITSLWQAPISELPEA
ncbi:MAG: adenylyl-sulfate kinase [Candidatus Polarisedimenticolia bacterium]